MITVTLTGIAHGGSAVGRVDGQVVFVRGAIPGETVTARLTGEGRRGRFLTAQTVDVIDPSPDRVTPPCPVAGICGGCDFQHVAITRQRQLKSQVLTEQLQRLGGVSLDVPVAAADPDALGWRTRMRFAAATTGEWGLRRHNSHDVVAIERCPIATEGVNHALADAPGSAAGSQLVIAEGADEVVACEQPGPLPGTLVERAAGRQWLVEATGFWQAHIEAPDMLVAAVAPHVADADRWWDLYCGVGLFAGALARPGVPVAAVEGDRRAGRMARRNLADLPDVRVHVADVQKWLPQGSRTWPPDVVVLDPPRTGVGREVVSLLSASAAGRLVHVACDPAALGRDVGYFRSEGWRVESVTGYDLFPMTHHVEAVAVLVR